MNHRIKINDRVESVSDIIGKAKISRGGTLYFDKSTREMIERISKQTSSEDIINSAKTIYIGTNGSIRITTKEAYDDYEKKLAEAVDIDTPAGRKLFRFFTTKKTDVDSDIDKLKMHKAYMGYMNLDFEDKSKRTRNVLICHKFRDEESDDIAGYYSIVNPIRTKHIILLSASLMSDLGRKLIKEAVGYLDEKTTDKKIVIIFNRKSNSDKEYEKAFIKGCKFLGFTPANITLSDDIKDDDVLRKIIMDTDFIYVPDGNVYATLAYINERGLKEAINAAVINDTKKVVYIGSSAGAAVAGKDISLIDYGEFDKNEVGLSPEELGGLGLFEGTIIPHYDKDEYLENLKESAIKDGNENIVKNYVIIERVGNEETLIL